VASPGEYFLVIIVETKCHIPFVVYKNTNISGAIIHKPLNISNKIIDIIVNKSNKVLNTKKCFHLNPCQNRVLTIPIKVSPINDSSIIWSIYAITKPQKINETGISKLADSEFVTTNIISSP
jgi:hypothetical protein